MKPTMLTQLLGFFYLVTGLLLLLNALSALVYQALLMAVCSVIVAAWCVNKYLMYLLGQDAPGGLRPPQETSGSDNQGV